MATAKQVINSIKPNLTKAPQGQTKKGSAGYDNIRDDIEKTKDLREGSIQKVPVNDDDIANKKYVDDSFPVTHASTTGQTTDDHHAKSHAHNGVDGSGTVAHSDTTGQGTDDHHPQVHTHTHASTTGQTTDDHHPQVHTHTHASTTGQGVDDHHAQTHTIVSHDTTATGANLTTLTDTSNADALHDHTEASVTVTHASTTGQGVDDHHNEDHQAEHEVGGGDLVNHDSLTGFVANEHIDWTNASDNLVTSGDVTGANINSTVDIISGDNFDMVNTGMLRSTDTGATQIPILFLWSDDDLYLSTRDDIVFRTGATTEKMRLTATGDLTVVGDITGKDFSGETLTLVKSATATNLIDLKNTHATGLSGVTMRDEGGTIKAWSHYDNSTNKFTIGGNAGVDTSIQAGNASHIQLSINGDTTFNSGSLATGDLVAKSNSNANMLFVDAGTNRVGIATGTPDTLLHVEGAFVANRGQLYINGGADNSFIVINNTDGTKQTGIRFDESNTAKWTLSKRPSNDDLAFYTPGVARLYLKSTGEVGVGTATPTIPLSTKEKSGMTAIGGFAIKLTNKTGANSVAGNLVKADTANNDAVVLTAAGDTECFGVFLESGITDGSEAWVVVSGIADVALDDNVASVRGNWMSTGVLAGYAATATSPAAAPTHFEEIGHCIETVAAGGGGTHILARCVLHFN